MLRIFQNIYKSLLDVARINFEEMLSLLIKLNDILLS
jgi:hypothetical protein